MIDITSVCEAVVALGFTVFIVVCMVVVKKAGSDVNRQEINAWIKIAVEAAEQIYTGSGRGEEKKQYVLKFLEGRGYTLDWRVLDAMIESAVNELKRGVL